MYNNSGQFNTNKETIKSILSENGYSFTDHGNYLSCGANYRNVPDTYSVVIYYNDDHVIDFAGGWKGNIHQFLQLVTNQKSEEELNKYLEKNNVVIHEVDNKPKIKQRKIFDKELLLHLVPNHSYLMGRGISEETAKLFGGGVAPKTLKGKLRGRYTFVIYSSKNEVVGFSGRTLDNNDRKYLHFGDKSTWIFPAHLNDKIISNCKSVILVEGPMDVLTLWTHGISNVICLFGTDLSLSILNYLLRRNVEKIIISLNNEPDNDNIGNHASLKIKKKLSRYFDSKNILIKLPPVKDFNEMNKCQLQKFMDELQMQVGYPYFNY